LHRGRIGVSNQGLTGEQEMGGARIAGIVAATVGAGMLWCSVAAAADEPIKKKNSEDTNRRVCKMIVPTGSRMGERICRTAAEWQADSDRARREFEQTRDTLMSPPCSPAIGCPK
jgi:uncharacterized RmlC-like cupin family protein